MVITDVDYWNQGTGHRARINRLLQFLHKYVQLTVIFLGPAPAQPPVDLKLVFLDRKNRLSLYEYGALLNIFMSQHTYDVCIIEYINNTSLLSFVPEETKWLLDMHDITSERVEAFKAWQHHSIDELTAEEEMEILGIYDHIIAICPNDRTKLSQYLPEEKIIVATHPPALVKRETRHKVLNIGFIGSDYAPNIDAARFFIKEIWPLVFTEHDNLKLSIYGRVAKFIQAEHSNIDCLRLRIDCVGFREDLDSIYAETDIIVNPVRFGAGLKIKNIEALANSMPLVTTTHGARGLESGINSAFFAEDDPVLFAACLNRLIPDIALRTGLSGRAYQFVNDHFSEQHSYGELLRVINA